MQIKKSIRRCQRFFHGRSVIPLLLLLMTAVFFTNIISGTVCRAGLGRHHAVIARKGVLDLRGTQFPESGPVKLDGEWAFYWDRLIDPEVFHSKIPPSPDGYFKVPLFWTAYKGRNLPPRGRATYRLCIKTDRNLHYLSIETPEIFSEYSLWINGGMIDRHGSFIKQPVRFLKPAVFSFPCLTDTVEIVLQIKNHSHGNAGIGQSFLLGTPDVIGKKYMNAVILEMFLIAVCLFAGFYHLVLFSFLRQEKELFYFGLFCIIIVVRTFFTGTTYIMQIFPDMPFEAGSRLATATIPLSVVSFFLFTYYFFKPLIRKNIFRCLMSANILYLLIIPFTPTFFFSSMFTWYLAVVSVTTLYALAVCVSAVAKKFRYAKFFLSGLVFLFTGVTNDMLHYLQVINTGYYLVLGFSAFIVSHSVMLAVKFANEHITVEKLSQRLQILDRLKDEFLANTSHELRTPVNGIIGISESLIDGVTGPLPEKTIHNLNIIASSGKRLSSLINDILDYSRLRNNDILIRKKQIDLKQLVAIVMTVVKATMPGKNIDMVNAIPDDFPFVMGDENRLQQILYNLIGNAFKFTDKGYIKVSAAIKGNIVEICVEDTGIGIDSAGGSDIFKSFEQVDGSDSREYGGTGLGLPITKQLVELHGGTIRFASRPGEGTVFVFTLQKSGDSEAAQPELPYSTVPVSYPLPDAGMQKQELQEFSYDVSGGKILVVDDEWINIQVLLNYLSGKYYAVDYALNGIEALEKIKDNKYDLILLDIMMPKMSGFEVCRMVRETFSSYELPILMLTAKNQTNDIIAAFNVGANDYIVKPFDKNELHARIETHLSLRRAVEKAISNAHLANTDQLTGLYNRRFFWEAGKLAYNRVQRYKEALSVVMLDIDRFKKVNDVYGHHAGDMVLEKLAVIISKNIRGVDVPGRYGGEEFIIILPGTGNDGAFYVAEKIRKLSEQERVDTDGKGVINFTVSAGVASCNESVNSFEELVRASDYQLYQAKQDGRNRVAGGMARAASQVELKENVQSESTH